MATTGREVASGTLWMTRDETSKVRVRVVARCGTQDCSHQGQVVIYEESNSLGGHAGVSDRPTRVLLLSTVAEVTSLNGSPVGANVVGISLEGRSTLPTSSLWGMMLLLTSGEAVELFADTREQQLQWVQYLNLLAMFPYSPIPEEPRNNPIRSSLRSKLNPSKYDADSVWLVYVLAEEVGSRVQALGVHIVTLRSSLSKHSPALMSVISPVDSEPIVTWEANKMRRTGSLGNMVFIEVGRRCEGGPGLIWMYACPEDATNYRDTLKRFLFMGDGRPSSATTITPATRQDKTSFMYDRVGEDPPTPHVTVASTSSSPSSSGGSSFRLSYSGPAPPVVKKSAEYDTADEEPTTLEYDYAFTIGPPGRSTGKSSTLPMSTTPPPINLVSHPSRKKDSTLHRRSVSIPNNKGTMETQVVGNCAGKQQLRASIDSGLASTISLEDDFHSIDESLSMIMSELNQTCIDNGGGTEVNKGDTEQLSDLINQLETFAASNEDVGGVKRSNTLPSGEKKPTFVRANSTSTCQPTHYMKLRNPKADLLNEGYVLMKSRGRLALDRLPEEATPFTEATPTRRENYDQLDMQEQYINHPVPADVAMGTPVMYEREYHNVTHSNGKGVVCEETPTLEGEEPIDEAIYMNHDLPPTTKREMDQLFTSAWSEIDNLQLVLDQLGTCD